MTKQQKLTKLIKMGMGDGYNMKMKYPGKEETRQEWKHYLQKAGIEAPLEYYLDNQL